MALKERGRVKRLTASSGGTLTAPNHESFRVTDLFCVPSANDTYLTLIIEGVTVGKWRVAGLAGNHVPYPAVETAQKYERSTGGLFAWLRAHGIDLTYPVATGQSLTVQRYAQTGEVTVVYDAFDRDDVAETEVNGPKAATRRYLHYVTNTAAITTSPVTLATSLIWPGGEQWPIGARDVPHATTIRLLGLFGAPVAHGDGSANKGYTTYLKLLREGDVLFDQDQNGLPFVGDSAQTADAASYKAVASTIGPLTAEQPQPPLLFPEPLAFGPGATLTPDLIVAGAAASGIAAAEVDLAFLLERETA